MLALALGGSLPFGSVRSVACANRGDSQTQTQPCQVSRSAQELLLALRQAAADQVQPELGLQQAAFDLAQAQRAAGNLSGALEIQRELHAALRMDWSALDLSLTLLFLGALPEAEALLVDQLPRSPAPVEIWNQLGLVALAGEREALAVTCFGRALRLGSENAGQSLGRLHLSRGRSDAAKALFRRGVDQVPPPPWSLPGWALCLLGPERAAP
jgi:tetratricopeptide (TPR) repeat protein